MTDPLFTPGALCALYLRDSGGNEQELSNDQQERVLREWAAANGLAVGRVFRDSLSGTSTRGRDDFLRLVRHFQHDPPESGVLIWRSNRFGRNIDDTQYFKAALRRRGYFVHSITDNIPEGPMGRFIEFALDWKDELFSAQLSEDVQRGLRDLVRIYGAVPGTPPRGFMRQPLTIGKRRDGQPHLVHKWVPDPALAPAVQRAFELRARGATLRTVQRETGLYKSTNCWATFFNNPLYKGVLKFADLTLENYCDPLVSPELWQAAQQTGLNRRHVKRDQSQARRLASSFLLSGLARCARCGALLSGHIIQAWKYYTCSRRHAKFDCDARYIPAEPFEAEVLRRVTDEILTLENLMQIQARLAGQYQEALADVETRRAELTRRLATVTRSISNLTATLAAHGPSDAVARSLRSFEMEATELRERIKSLEKQSTPPPALTSATMTEIAAELTTLLTTGDIEQKRYYLKAFIQSISAQRDEDAIRGCIQYHPPFMVQFS